MLEIAFAIGIFSYSIFFLGLVGLLYSPVIITFSLVYWITCIFFFRKILLATFQQIFQSTYHPFVMLSAGYIAVQACINSVGLFGPEIGFDATWYHLTLPKLYLIYHAILHFPGGVLYYSDMPKLTEMLYTAGLAFGSDFWARGVHFLFGILTCIVLYKISRKFLPQKWASLVPVIFYSSLVVGWESISGYIDLSRTFFTTIALFAFLEWVDKKERKWFVSAALLVGLTVATKILALPDIAMYAFVLFFFEKNKVSTNIRLKRIISFILVSCVPILPWLVFAYIHTGNPVYPIFSSTYVVQGYWQQVLNPLLLFKYVWDTFAASPDPIHPIFLAILPFFIMSWKTLRQRVPLLVMFTVGSFTIWYVTPQSGGGRYILPYLPIFSLITIFTITFLQKKWQMLFLLFIFFVAGISLIYRGVAVAKFLPVISGHETKAHFMTNHLDFQLGEFYDTDGYFAHHIKSSDRVLLYGFHNMYNIQFPFISSDWAKPGDTFNFIAVQGNGVPDRFRYWNLIYYNPTTHVRLYSLQNKQWLF